MRIRKGLEYPNKKNNKESFHDGFVKIKLKITMKFLPNFNSLLINLTMLADKELKAFVPTVMPDKAKLSIGTYWV